MKAIHGHDKAVTAAAHKLARIIYHMLQTRQPYVDRGEEYFLEKNRDRQIKNLLKKANALGFYITPVAAYKGPVASVSWKNRAKASRRAFFEVLRLSILGGTPSDEFFWLLIVYQNQLFWKSEIKNGIKIAKRPTIPVITTFKLSTVLAAGMLLPVHSSLLFSAKRTRKMLWSLRLPHPVWSRPFRVILTWWAPRRSRN